MDAAALFGITGVSRAGVAVVAGQREAIAHPFLTRAGLQARAPAVASGAILDLLLDASLARQAETRHAWAIPIAGDLGLIGAHTLQARAAFKAWVAR